jgi:hypothetical protein
VDMAALADFVPVRPEAVAALPTTGHWRVRTKDATITFDLDARTVRQSGGRRRSDTAETAADGPSQTLVEVQECSVGVPLRFSVVIPLSGSGSEGEDGGPDRRAASSSAATAGRLDPDSPPRTSSRSDVREVHHERVRYLEELDPDRAKRAQEHLALWADESLPAPLRAAHLCAASHFGATRAELGQAVGLSGRQLRDRLSGAVVEAMVELRARRGDPERVPLGDDGQPGKVARWMTEERVRRSQQGSAGPRAHAST